MFCTELKQLSKFSTGAEEHLPCGVTLLESGRQSRMKVFFFDENIYFHKYFQKQKNEDIDASTCLCEIIIPQVLASLEYEDFRTIAFSASINGNCFNCV